MFRKFLALAPMAFVVLSVAFMQEPPGEEEEPEEHYCCVPAVRVAEDGTACTQPCANPAPACESLTGVCTVLIGSSCPETEKKVICNESELAVVNNYMANCIPEACAGGKKRCRWQFLSAPCSVQKFVDVCSPANC